MQDAGPTADEIPSVQPWRASQSVPHLDRAGAYQPLETPARSFREFRSIPRLRLDPVPIGPARVPAPRARTGWRLDSALAPRHARASACPAPRRRPGPYAGASLSGTWPGAHDAQIARPSRGAGVAGRATGGPSWAYVELTYEISRDSYRYCGAITCFHYKLW